MSCRIRIDVPQVRTRWTRETLMKINNVRQGGEEETRGQHTYPRTTPFPKFLDFFGLTLARLFFSKHCYPPYHLSLRPLKKTTYDEKNDFLTSRGGNNRSCYNPLEIPEHFFHYYIGQSCRKFAIFPKDCIQAFVKGN